MLSVRSLKQYDLIEFLTNKGFTITNTGEKVWQISHSGELPVYLHIGDTQIYFEVDLGNISSIASETLYFTLLDLNTEILPVSLGIDTSNSEDPRLVLVESRELENLDDNELLAVFAALEIATDKVEAVISEFIQ